MPKSFFRQPEKEIANRGLNLQIPFIMKRLRLLTPFIAIALLISGCGQKTASDSSNGPAPAIKGAIAVIPKGTTHVYWQSVRAGAEAAARELGYKIYWNGPERETDRERQIQIIEDFIVQKVDGIVLAPLDRKALVPTVEKLAAFAVTQAGGRRPGSNGLRLMHWDYDLLGSRPSLGRRLLLRGLLRAPPCRRFCCFLLPARRSGLLLGCLPRRLLRHDRPPDPC